MSASVVQLTGATFTNTSSATFVLPVTNTPTLHNHIIYFGQNSNTSATISSVVDNGTVGNTWNVRFQPSDGGIESFLIDALITDTSLTSITVTFSVASNPMIAYGFEASGLSQSSWFSSVIDHSNVFFNATARNLQSNNVAGTQVGDLLMCGWTSLGSNETSLTPNSPWVNLPTATGSGYYTDGTTGFAEGVYLIAPDTTGRQPTATGGSSPVGYTCFGAVYLMATGPAPPGPKSFRTGVNGGACVVRPYPFAPGVAR